MDTRRLPSWIACELPATPPRRTLSTSPSRAKLPSSPRSPHRSRRGRPIIPKGDGTSPRPASSSQKQQKQLEVKAPTTFLIKDAETTTTTEDQIDTEIVPKALFTVENNKSTTKYAPLISSQLSPELENERLYLLHLCYTDDVNLLELKTRIMAHPETVQPVKMQAQTNDDPKSFIPSSFSDGNSTSQDRLSSLKIKKVDSTRFCDGGDEESRMLHTNDNVVPSDATGTSTLLSSFPPRQQSDRAKLHEQTILGALCSINTSSVNNKQVKESNTNTDCAPVTVGDVVQLVLEICPWQVRCSQRKAGHTPFRDAVRNPSCSSYILKLLVRADEAVTKDTGDNRSVVNVRDRDGLSPIDHLMRSVQFIGPDSDGALSKLQVIAENASVSSVDTNAAPSSPLLHLLSLGSSFGVSDRSGVVVNDPARMHRILACTRILLEWDPTLIHKMSQTTGCSPLHVGIRSYGNCGELIRELIERDDSNCSVMRHRNQFGDLPLHVACSVGVPMDIMRLVLARTLMAERETMAGSLSSHSLVWSTNNYGFTPVDLEWIRHIEAGHGFFSHRSFYPLDARGVRGVHDNLYDNLLRQAVDQVLGQSPRTMSRSQRRGQFVAATHNSTDANAIASMDEPPENLFSEVNDTTFGLLLHRIFLVVRASFCDSFTRSQFDLSGDILHQAAALSGPNGPTLPRPVLELILWQHPEQVERRDHTGKFPLHHAVQLHRPKEKASIKSAKEWRLWVQKLLSRGSTACSISDNQGRLPLHYALDYPSAKKREGEGSDGSYGDGAEIAVQEARNTIVNELTDCFPKSVQTADPVSKLYPFQMAAANPLVSLDTLFTMLRAMPGVIHNSKAD